MKKNKTFILLTVLLIVLIAGAGFFYNKLSSTYKTDSLTETSPSSKNKADSDEKNKEGDSQPEENKEKAEIEEDAQTSDTKESDSSHDSQAEASGDESRTASEETDSGENAAETAPDFTMTDASGEEVKLSDFFGKPVVLNFWASWCGPCKSEMPHFEEAYQKYGEDINFVIVNLTDGSRETVETASAFIEEQGYTFPVYFDTSTEGAMTYGTYSIPVTYFIAADGTPVAQASGALDAATLQKGLDMIQ